MKSWPDSKSPWGKQLRFEEDEFEAMMDEMRGRAGSECFTPGKGVDVDLVVLRAIETEADYVDLPAGVMGRTIFGADGSATIEISRSLSEEAEHDRVAERRLRTTVAHECGHVACHRGLFMRDTETFSLFAVTEGTKSAVTKPPIMCREESVGRIGYNGQWWEYQANRCMAALLLPRRLFGASAKRCLGDGGFKSGEECLNRGYAEHFVRELSDEYNVSQQATLLRLQALGYLPSGTQARLRLVD